MMHVVLHKPFYPFTMFWPTDDVFNNLPEERKTWLYNEEHRDKLQAYLKAHIVRNQKVRNLHDFAVIVVLITYVHPKMFVLMYALSFSLWFI